MVSRHDVSQIAPPTAPTKPQSGTVNDKLGVLFLCGDREDHDTSSIAIHLPMMNVVQPP